MLNRRHFLSTSVAGLAATTAFRGDLSAQLAWPQPEVV